MSVPSEILNEMFTQNIDDPGERTKIADAFGSYIRDRLREESFARKVVPPVQVTRTDLQRSVNHDTLTKVVDIEPQSRAMAITFRDQPRARVIRGERYEIGFYTISSEKFEKTEQELLAYEMPITKIVEDNSLKDIQEIEDREFLLHCESAVQRLQIDANGGAVHFDGNSQETGATVACGVTKGDLARTSPTQTSFAVLPLQRPDLTDLFKLFPTRFASPAPGGRLRCDRILMTDPDFEDMMLWTIEEFGDKVQSEVVVDGYKYNQVMGRKYIRTIKTDILTAGTLYAFTTPDFFARFYILNNTKFYIDKIANRITWQAWEDIGMGIGNIASVRKLELFAASVSGVAPIDAGFATRLPSAEDDLGAANNRAGDGFTFPTISSF